MNTSNIIIALEIMAKGMAGIFTAILIIILCVWLRKNRKINTPIYL